MTERKFKVGDRVRAIQRTYYFPIGFEAVIKSIETIGKYSLIDIQADDESMWTRKPPHTHSVFYEHRFELISTEPTLQELADEYREKHIRCAEIRVKLEAEGFSFYSGTQKYGKYDKPLDYANSTFKKTTTVTTEEVL